ncbi:nuclear transport factor 2 family protein [Ruania halotolerans]|uniref:nuclear transport factor 2 family protein n=1 Tax=Ruania halotolerans TaxID=2897773 RepID=UPI001E2D5BEE|nr:nuclear transport factor 2 family protein [Ruania halotolerans]UFU07895.1 nuclear transport factor 2 family protein [Ruania halotolerans]
MSTMAELLALEHEGWQSLCRGTGGAHYGRVMTEDGVMVLAHGMVFDRAAVIDSLDQAPTWDDYQISDERVVDGAAGADILVYTARATRAEQPPFVALMSSVYVQRNGERRLALYQQTPIPDAAGSPS